VRSADNVFEHLAEAKIDAAQVRLAEQLIEHQTGTFDATAFVDRYQTSVKALIRAKLEGGPPIQVLPEATAPVIDLTTALKRSLGRTANRVGSRRKKTAVAA
jgi:DNA end-binding protein Ku